MLCGDSTSRRLMIQKAYRFRIYPTKIQAKQLAQYFGCVRFVSNYCLALRNDLYEYKGESVNSVPLDKHINYLKSCGDYDWLKECPSSALQQSLRDQDKAFTNFFQGRAKYPKFKKKQSKQSLRLTLDQRRIATQYQCGKLLKLPKLGEIKLRWSRIPKGIPKMVTVSKNPDDRYYVSFSCEEARPKVKTKQSVIGVDVGIKDVAVTSDGFSSGAPKYTYRYARRLKLEQRKLSRKTKGSNRWHKQRVQVAKVHAKIGFSRADFLHKLTSRLIAENLVVCIENLNVAGMVKNRKLSKAVSDVGMFEFRRQLEYKAQWYGSTVVKVGRFFPSTKMCSGCGSIHDMPLSKRVMQCDCGVTLDRDENAARNIKAEGIRSLHADGDTYRLTASAESSRHRMKRGLTIQNKASRDEAA